MWSGEMSREQQETIQQFTRAWEDGSPVVLVFAVSTGPISVIVGVARMTSDVTTKVHEHSSRVIPNTHM